MKGKTVFVGMSGGVDSSVSALLLKEQGYHVVGVFIKVWHPDFLVCHWEKERLDAMRVAAHLDIPFLTCNAEESYKNDVADYFIEEYRRGRTPNPDVMCNTFIKFGHFYKFAREKGADFIATGHYAQMKIGTAAMCRGGDTAKDQSYFLWNVSREALLHTLFPVGHMQKTEVRAHALRAHIPTAKKSDSQGICFLGHVDMFDFLSHYIALHEGEVHDENGVVIGSHKGVALYTEGQRHGFTLFPDHTETQPYFVQRKDSVRNLLVVSPTKDTHTSGKGTLRLSRVRWHLEPSTVSGPLTCQMRYRQTPTAVTLLSQSDTCAELMLHAYQEIPAPGQSCVLYNGDRLVGGGIIESFIT